MSPEQQLYAEMVAEWEAAGPPAPITTSDASWAIGAVVMIVMLAVQIMEWFE